MPIFHIHPDLPPDARTEQLATLHRACLRGLAPPRGSLPLTQPPAARQRT
ncbi:MAG: hypothetical protein LKK00_03595 [Intestinimonas sp.]|jgi:hypothetical protein|nr:hypothetical protein [Intestinimonas sp.]